MRQIKGNFKCLYKPCLPTVCDNSYKREFQMLISLVCPLSVTIRITDLCQSQTNHASGQNVDTAAPAMTTTIPNDRPA